MAKAKEVLGDNACTAGNLPTTRASSRVLNFFKFKKELISLFL
jgi:hypothetical protein